MSRRTSTPLNQVKLSNVAVVRLQRGGQRFEVACYRSKVVDYRSGKERDLDEVLQVQSVFYNVSKGILASAKEVKKAFGSEAEACVQILKHGELQVSEREREAQLASLFRDIASIVADKTVDTRTGRPPPVTSIERYMHDELHFGVSSKLTAKQQALDVIKRFEALPDFGVRRAPMRLRITSGELDLVRSRLEAFGARFSHDSFLVEPRHYKDVVRAVTESAARLEIVEHAARGEDVSEDKKSSPPRVAVEPQVVNKAAAPARPRLSCNTCATASFVDAAQHRDHFKSEWHRCNLKRKLDNQPPLSELDFQQLGLLRSS